MYFLFIDTSSSNFLALFEQEEGAQAAKLIERRDSLGRASFIQAQVHDLLTSHRLELGDINCCYYGAGPGSYTGMRVTQGVIGTFEILGIKTAGVYLYECLNSSFATSERGTGQLWLSSAFKGEYFIYRNSEKKLVDLNEAKQIVLEGLSHIYSHNSEEVKDLNFKPLCIFDLICRDFSIVRKLAGPREPYYYRPLEVEFKVATKVVVDKK